MKKLLLITLVLGTIVSCKNESETVKPITVDYPETKKVDTVDNYFDVAVADPYRWLEIDTAQEVEEWVTTQNEVTFGYLEQIPFRHKIRQRLEELYNYTKVSSPIKVGEYYFFYHLH